MRVQKLIFLILLMAAIIFGVVSPGYAQGQQVETIEISQIDGSKFPSVTLYVRILDAQGNKVPDLQRDQFSVSEDGKAVEVVDFQSSNSSTIVTLMMMDVSGSMGQGNKIESARDAATTFVDLMRKDDQVALWVFNHNIRQVTDFTNDQSALKRDIASFRANGGTSWYDALIECSKEIQTQTGRRSLLLLSDGVDENSSSSFSSARKAAVDSQVPVYTIGLGSGMMINEKELDSLAKDTGGKYYQAPSASQLKELYAEISKSTQEEYVITYKSPRASFDGTRRNINIEVNGKTGTGRWTESHLLNIQSDPLVALIAALPLLALLVVPATGMRIASARKKAAPALAPTPPPFQPAPGAQAFCTNCGQPLRPGAKFCNVCGSVQPASPPPQPRPAVFSPQNPPQPSGQYRPQPPVTPPAAPAPQAAAQAPKIPKFCTKCGNPMRPGVRFCSRCGTRYD